MLNRRLELCSPVDDVSGARISINGDARMIKATNMMRQAERATFLPPWRSDSDAGLGPPMWVTCPCARLCWSAARPRWTDWIPRRRVRVGWWCRRCVVWAGSARATELCTGRPPAPRSCSNLVDQRRHPGRHRRRARRPGRRPSTGVVGCSAVGGVAGAGGAVAGRPHRGLMILDNIKPGDIAPCSSGHPPDDS